MNRSLQYVNLIGVLALAILCAAQWRANRLLHLQAIELEALQQEQTKALADREAKLKGAGADLDTFRQQLARLSDAVKAADAKAAATERDVRQLTVEREQLKTSVTNWAAAVTVRDERLKEAQAQLQKLVQERNETVAKYNQLAAKFNDVVKDLNEARARLAAPKAEP
jgi:DNA recombination protein RmuC